MSGSTSSDSNQTAARKKRKTKRWSDGLVNSATALELLLTKPHLPKAELFTKPALLALLEAALESIRLDNGLDLQVVGSWVDQELEQLYARINATSDDASEWAKGLLIPELEIFKNAIVAFNMPPPSSEAILQSQTPPSDFAKDWHIHQRKSNHLCLRPPEMKGLPLELLHPAFGTFRQTLADPYPPPNIDDTVIQATNAATELCAVMGCHYKNEKQRGSAFVAALNPLFEKGKWISEYQVPDINHSRRHVRLDGVYYDNPKIRLVREEKPDASNVEAYMQLVHGYGWVAGRTVNEELSHQENGAPMLLFLIKGTEFLVAGATFNGTAVVAKPLGTYIPMLEDWACRPNSRRTVLAHHLYAARRAYDQLMSASFHVPYKPIQPHPDIYPTHIEWEGSTGHFQFNPPHTYLTTRTLLFGGTIKWDFAQTRTESPTENETSSNLTGVVIKLVYGPYGQDLHNYLASKNFAPKLYGVIEDPHRSVNPRAIVMEDLHGPTPTEAGWVSLYTLLKGAPLPVGVQQKIFEVIAEIARTIMRQGFVHGDLRSPNLMIRIPNKFSHNLALDSKGRAQLKVVDFDWAGLANTVRYPLQRNNSENWPGEDGGLISAGDDWKLIKNWWSKKYPHFDLSPYDARVVREGSIPPDPGAGN